MCMARTSLLTASPAARIAALADTGSIDAPPTGFAASRRSPHLARWGIAAQDDDGIVVARATIGHASVFVAAQDERYLGGTIGANHAAALRALCERARSERPDALILLFASGGLRLHEANPAELELARALAALLDLRAAGIPVLAVGVGDVFGGASVLACAADRVALLPGVRFGLSGPAVIETALGRDELDTRDAEALARLYGAETRAAAGHIEQLPDSIEAIRRWIGEALAARVPFSEAVRAMQARLGARLESVAAGATLPCIPLPRAVKSLFARAEPADGAGWLWRIGGTNVFLTRAFGIGSFGPQEAHALDAALLAHLAGGAAPEDAVLILVGDSTGHERSRAAEALCISQYLAHHAAVIALLRHEGLRMLGLLAGVGHSGAFFCNALQARALYALPEARVVAMEPAAIARVTRQDPEHVAALVEDDPLLGHPVRHFARWGGVTGIVPDADAIRVLALAARHAAG